MDTRLVSCAIIGFVCVLLAASQGTSRAEPLVQTRLLKVFLADFDDVPHPARYSREYFEQLVFGVDSPRQTPEGKPLSGSVRDYFQDLSERRIKVEGEVADWVRIPRKITKVPHWKPGMTPFGESWPVIVAETLRANGIVGKDAEAKLKLKDGRRPDLLVFLNTDWGVGGVNRGWGQLEDVLGKMQLGNLWDPAWAELPSPFSSFSATIWRQAPGTGPDGTIDRVPSAAELELFPLSIMMHEMGHQFCGWPDLYGPAFEPWGVFDLMGGPAASTHYPMSVSAFLRVSSGWMQYTDVDPASHPGLELEPLETHREALRFRQGPGQESIIAENRWCLKYPGDYSVPPVNEGPRLLFYRVDEAGRRRMMYGDNPVGKITTMIRRPEAYGEVWGGAGFTELTAATAPSSRNSLGELWWEFRAMHADLPDPMRFDADFRASDLVRGYRRAAWTDGEGTALDAGRYGGLRGYVCIVPATEKTQPRLRVASGSGGLIRGRYPLPAGEPRRLYVTLSLVGALAGKVAVTVAPSVGEPTRLDLAGEVAGQARTLIVELPAQAQAAELIVQAPPGAAAVVDISEAWVVGLPRVTAELAHAAATWTPAAPAPATGSAVLHDGCTYGPAVLTVPVGGDAPSTRQAAWEVTVPKGPAMLRGLFGLTADTLGSSRSELHGEAVTVAVTLAVGEHTWRLVSNLEISAPAAADTANGWPAVVETNIPAEALGQTCKVVLEVSTKSGKRATLAVPALFLSP